MRFKKSLLILFIFVVILASSSSLAGYGRSVKMNLAFHIGDSKSNDEINYGNKYAIVNDSVAAGLLFSGAEVFNTSVNTGYSSSDNMLQLKQSLDGNKFYIVCAKSNFSGVYSKVSQIDKDRLLAKTFSGYEQTKPRVFPVFIRLEYENVDILNKTDIKRGTLLVKNEGKDERGLWRISLAVVG
ncbi:MAG: hypothetical protein HZB67_02595 [Candidatus Aenigmarchaeota archaeon]|nr:hypothetical protein [Candidatus Aenigmarchaeota archaeon]